MNDTETRLPDDAVLDALVRVTAARPGIPVDVANVLSDAAEALTFLRARVGELEAEVNAQEARANNTKAAAIGMTYLISDLRARVVGLEAERGAASSARDMMGDLWSKEGASAKRAEAQLAEARADAERLVGACRPFVAAVYNDNGDVTISTGHITMTDWLALDTAHRAIIAAQDRQ